MTQKHTNMCKGVAICMMYIHHLFYDFETFADTNITFFVLSAEKVVGIAQIFKVCVSVFVFLTGYGYTKSEVLNSQKYKAATGKRLLRLMFGYWFIFILASITSFLRCPPQKVYSQEMGMGVFEILIDALGLSFAFGTPTLNATWWYMSYAILLIFVTPYIIKAVRYCQFAILPMTILILGLLPKEISMNTVFRYVLPLILGILAAEFEVFEKSQEMFQKKYNIDFLIIILACMHLSFIRHRMGNEQIIDGILAMLVCYLVFRFLGKVPVIGIVLNYLGIHSMNLFLLHTFVYLYYFKDFIYSFQYPVLIVGMLLIITFFISVVIEKMKELVGYDKLQKKLIQKYLYGTETS